MALKHCISCSMPMTKPEDFPAGDFSKDYCIHCARPDGTMKSYDEVLEGLTNFIIKMHGLTEEEARSAAKGVMMSLPAWHDVPGC
jgi:hypothetical protein